MKNCNWLWFDNHEWSKWKDWITLNTKERNMDDPKSEERTIKKDLVLVRECMKCGFKEVKRVRI